MSSNQRFISELCQEILIKIPNEFNVKQAKVNKSIVFKLFNIFFILFT